MKKLKLLVALLCVSAAVHAQSFGLKAGMNSTTISGSSLATSKIAFHVGAWGEFKMAEKVSIMPELVYSAQGSAITGSSDKVNLSYLNIPVMLNYYMTDNIFIQAGPQIGFLMSAATESTGGSTDIKQYLSSTDFTLGFGLGGQWDNFMANFRYNLGITDTIADENFKQSIGVTGSMTNSVIQISLGYKFKSAD
jgi:hypothetical protein